MDEEGMEARRSLENRAFSAADSSATTGAKARDEVIAILRRFGCESVGFMDDFDRHEVLLAFTL